MDASFGKDNLSVAAYYGFEQSAVLAHYLACGLVVLSHTPFPFHLRKLVLKLQVFTKLMAHAAKERQSRDHVQALVGKAALMNVHAAGVDDSFKRLIDNSSHCRR
jgi:hypothetical protein